MPVVDNQAEPEFVLPGLHHRTLAGPEQGMRTLEVWSQTIEAGAATPVHRHACEEAIVVLEGRGRLTIEGEDTEFGPHSTLIIPADVVHQIANIGDGPMKLIAALSAAPVKVRHADDRAMPLPWQAPR